MLVNDALGERRLVRILPPQEDMLSSKVHIVRWPSKLMKDGRVKAFTSWLLQKARETVAH